MKGANREGLSAEDREAIKQILPAETVEQFAGQREKMITKFDVNGDGELDQAERNTAKQTIPKAMQQKLKGQRR